VIYKPRKQLISIRVTDEEAAALRSLARDCGARSMTEFVRTIVFGYLSNRHDAGGLSHHVNKLEVRVNSLERLVEQLTQTQSIQALVASEESAIGK
jgi:hypothetical protein